MSGDRNKYRGKALVDCIEAISRIYHEFEEKFREEMGRAVPYVTEAYYQDALHDMGEKITGKFDTKRAEAMLQDSYSHIAGATEFMSATQVGNLRNIVSRVLRTAGMTGMTSREVQGELLRLLTADFTFTDAKGRVWNTEAYIKMLARTTLMNAGRETYLDTCADKGKDVVRISISGDACPKCAEWENRLVSLSGKTKGLPLLQNAIDGGLFHPNCTHSTVAVGDWDRETNFDKNGRPKEGWNSAKNPNPKGDDPDANREYRKQQAEKAKKQAENRKYGQADFSKIKDTAKKAVDPLKKASGKIKNKIRFKSEAKKYGWKPIHGEHCIEDDLKNTNPMYHKEKDLNGPYHKNCQRAVTAYEARRRGHNVYADKADENLLIPGLDEFIGDEGWTTAFKDGNIIDCSAPNGIVGRDKVIAEISKFSDNSRFGVKVIGNKGVGHIFAAEKIDGKIYFIDPQSGSMNAEDNFFSANGQNIKIMRLDNLEFSDKVTGACKGY